MATLKDIVKKIGLSPLKLENGQSVNLTSLIGEMFNAIIDECRKKGGSVKIKDFGTFSARINKGRKLKTPLMEGGEVEFGDILLLKFHLSTVSKKRLNAGRAVESWGGKFIERKPRPSDIKKAKATKAPAKKSTTKAPSKKPPAKKSTTKAPAKKSTTKAPAKKSTTKAPSKKPPAKKSTTKAPSKKPPSKKSTTKAPSKKPPSKKSTTKAPSKKPPSKKSTTKVPAKKSASKK